MKASELKAKWRKDIDKDFIRELQMDDNRLTEKEEKCPEAIQHEAYDWCNLSDNICIRNTGNSDFDVDCEWYNDFINEIKGGENEQDGARAR